MTTTITREMLEAELARHEAAGSPTRAKFKRPKPKRSPWSNGDKHEKAVRAAGIVDCTAEIASLGCNFNMTAFEVYFHILDGRFAGRMYREEYCECAFRQPGAPHKCTDSDWLEFLNELDPPDVRKPMAHYIGKRVRLTFHNVPSEYLR